MLNLINWTFTVIILAGAAEHETSALANQLDLSVFTAKRERDWVSDFINIQYTQASAARTQSSGLPQLSLEEKAKVIEKAREVQERELFDQENFIQLGEQLANKGAIPTMEVQISKDLILAITNWENNHGMGTEKDGKRALDSMRLDEIIDTITADTLEDKQNSSYAVNALVNISDLDNFRQDVVNLGYGTGEDFNGLSKVELGEDFAQSREYHLGIDFKLSSGQFDDTLHVEEQINDILYKDYDADPDQIRGSGTENQSDKINQTDNNDNDSGQDTRTNKVASNDDDKKDDEHGETEAKPDKPDEPDVEGGGTEESSQIPDWDPPDRDNGPDPGPHPVLSGEEDPRVPQIPDWDPPDRDNGPDPGPHPVLSGEEDPRVPQIPDWDPPFAIITPIGVRIRS